VKKISVVIKLLPLIIALLLVYSCKKDPGNLYAPGPVLERVSSIHGLKGGFDDYMEEYHYDESYLSAYFIYRPGKEGEWKNWLRFSYEYPSADVIIETREGFADSVWFPANKNEKKYHGEQLEELVQYEYDMGFPGNWRPIKKINWDFIGDLPVERTTWTYHGGWENTKRSEYVYTGSLWTALITYGNTNGLWDTVGCMALIYKGGNLAEVNIYECNQAQVWKHNEQYLLYYQGSSLAEMIIYTCPGDSLEFERAISVGYNLNGHVDTYITDFECCPTEEMQITYEEGRGNFRKATLGCSNYMRWPWFPVPVKK
jgi:hypothetical protein